MNKNIAGYCGYIGLISFVAYRPDTARLQAPESHRSNSRLSAQSVTEHVAAS
ncbi:hypothetical protein PQQ51_13570 [Paraburkholderia xenovorans]|uniref:hypothetical protein n=1 Tax=Paraburkholderia xenovorans TaxID=36873 RepID=UPI0038B72789